VLRIELSAEKPPHRIAPIRWQKYYENQTDIIPKINQQV